MKNKKIRVLPSQVFFNPTNVFLDWTKKNLKGHLVIDCGAGTGRLARLLKNQGISVLAIDICDREETEHIILNQDSTTLKFSPKSVAIIARPSRGQWIQETIYNALKTCSFVLYIGIEEHIEEDIDSLVDVKTEKILNNAGDEKEVVYKISKKNNREPMKTKYYLVSKEAAKEW